jgi:hypothetical protein
VEEPRLKGSIYVQARNWTDEREGAGTFLRLLAEAGFAAPKNLLPGSWYPAAPLYAALRAAGSLRNLDAETAVASVARMNALEDLTTIYRIFLRIAAPLRVLGNAPKVWSTYCNFATPGLRINEPGHFIGTIDSAPPDLTEFVVGACRGFLPAAVELAGGKSVTFQVLSRTPCEFEIRYK